MRILPLALLLTACIPSPYGLALGEECELNSDCDAPLVCRIGYCRVECSTSRDCAAGLDCLQDNDGLGACQLPAETTCTNDSDCPATLVCTMGECANGCGACTAPGPCRDCPAGADCVRDDDGALGCFDPSTRSCVYSSECGFMGDEFVCAFDGRCRLECRSDCDCRNGEACRTRDFAGENVDGGVVSGLICVLPREGEAPSDCLPDTGSSPSDGGLASDVGTADAGTDDAGTDDAGTDDAGADDAGSDAP
jgi:hypothetical protein